MKLRDYQHRAIAAARAQYAAGRRAVCLVSPTGAGKTVIGAEMIRLARTRNRRVLFAAHRAELISQSVRKLEAAGVTDLRVIQASADLGDPNAPVIVASIQTLASKRWADRLPDVDFVILDECHHTPAKTWAGIAGRYRNAQLLGLTATPQRADGRPLGDIFDSLVVGATVRELVDLGHLVPCRVFAPLAVLETAQVAQSPVDAYLKYTPNERAVVFCVTVEHAQRVAADMSAAGIRTGVVHGNMGREQRAATLRALDEGDIDAVASCHVLTEGWDSPAVSSCILARKPQHTGLYLQMVGRVLRPAPGKTHATLIDLCGSVHDHGPPDLERSYTLTGRGISKPDRDAIRQCLTCGGVFRAGPATCPLCGCELPRNEVKIPTAVGVELVALDGLPKLKPRAVTLSITAKYPGTCHDCRGAIAVGEQILWIKGTGARHVSCKAVAA
jgi:DNA repair protein RadD